MKGFLVLFCCLVATQARNTAIQSSDRALANLGENPWLVHLRIAVSTSGFLDSGAGTLINEGWVLTAYNLVENARFAWVRYGVTTVWNPSLVTEVSDANIVRSPQVPVALLRLNRVVHSTPNYSPITLNRDAISAVGRQCGFGANEEGGPGEQLSCENAMILKDGPLILTSGALEATKYDLGAPLVHEDQLLGVLINTPQEGDIFSGQFVATESFLDWVEEQIN